MDPYQLPDGMTPEEFFDKIRSGKVIINVYDINPASTIEVVRHITHNKIMSLGNDEAHDVLTQFSEELTEQCLLVLTLDSKLQFNGICVVQLSHRYYAPTSIKFFDIVQKMNGGCVVGVIFKPGTRYVSEEDEDKAREEELEKMVAEKEAAEEESELPRLAAKKGELKFIAQLIQIGDILGMPVMDVIIANNEGYLSGRELINVEIGKHIPDSPDSEDFDPRVN